jgi:hypothetical protein
MNEQKSEARKPSWLRRMIYLFRRLIRLLTWIYLLRFPLLMALVLVALPVIAWFTEARSLLQNLFDLNSRRIFVVSLTAFLAAWSVMVTTRLARLYGAIRFRVAPAGIRSKLKWRNVFAWSALAWPVTIGAVWQSTDGFAWKLSGVSLGFLGALTLLCGAALVQKLVVNFDVSQHAPDLLIPARVPGAQRLFDRARRRPPLFNPSPQAAELLRKIPGDLGRGYIDYQDRTSGLPLLSGHISAATLFILFLLVYLVVGYLASPWRGWSMGIPSLAYVLLLLTMLNWGLSGITFFLDRYRIPVLMTVGVWLFITSQFSASDYYYDLRQLKTQTANPQPTAPVEARRKVIVVAANGGGIQAAAWTAQVLTGLELQCRAELKDKPREFGRTLRLISAVSGGSVGAMYFTNAWRGPDGLADDAVLGNVVEQAMSSSLDQVAWGLVYPDLMRSFFPFAWATRETDRGQALERAWRMEAGLTETLLDWRAGVREGWRPATIFNATIVDTGERLTFSTSDLRPVSRGGRTFSELFPDSDIPITTAVRLSATFPFVTPAARANAFDPVAAKYHVVDGGYYDNYGTASLAEWLDAAFENPAYGFTDVLVLLVRCSPTGIGVEPEESRGWFYQSFAPFSTLLHVRNAGQLSRSEVELDLLQRAWRAGRRNIEILPFQFSGEPPLSWHLTAGQKQNIRDEWPRELFERKGKDGRSKWDQVKSFLSR